MKNIILVMAVFVLLCSSCEEENPGGQPPQDGVAPGSISAPEVENIPGGAIIRYVPPSDEDLLYIKASFTLKDGMTSEVRSSLYSDSVLVQGFGDMLQREVKIVAVDRSKNESQAVTVNVVPLEPPVSTIGKSLFMLPDFGGVHAYWENPTQAQISIRVLYKDHNNEYVPLETFYSTLKAGDGAKREMDTIQHDIRVYVQDRWENRSEHKDYTLTPLFERKLNRLLFQDYKLADDVQKAAGGGAFGMTQLWDDKSGEEGNGFFTEINQPWPSSFTFGLGVDAKISRIRVFQRVSDAYTYAEGNIKEFEVYGSNTLDNDWSTWTKLMDCRSIKPSGLPILQFTQEDRDRAVNGEDFVVDAAVADLVGKIKYIRIRVNKTWSGTKNFQICELQVFGDDRN
jgi:hypothetical protein